MIITKNQLRKIIKNNLIESRFILGDYEEEDDEDQKFTSLSAKNISKHLGSKLNFINFDNNDQANSFIKDIAGPDVFISFIDPYEKDINTGEMNVPSFSLNPNAAFNTPHGIYGYPFDKKNCEKFLLERRPTDSPFATDREYFHLIRIDLNHPNVIIFNENGTSNRNISNHEYLKDLNEMIRVHCKYHNKDDKQKEEIIDIINERISYGLDEQIQFIRNNENNENDDNIINENKYKKIRQNFYKNNYYRLYKAAGYLSFNNIVDYNFHNKVDSGLNDENHSILYSLLLNVIGLKCVIDYSYSIHIMEPNQVHILTLGENKSFYEYIGTLKNNIDPNPFDFKIYLDKMSNADALKFYSSISTLYGESSLCYNKDLIDVIFNKIKLDDHTINEFLKLIHLKLLKNPDFINDEQIIKKVNEILSDNFIKWLKFHGNNLSYTQRFMKEALGIKVDDDLINEYQDLEDWILLLNGKGFEQIKFLLKTYIFKKYSYLEILQTYKNVDLNTFELIYAIIMKEKAFNEKLKLKDKVQKIVLLNLLSNIDISIFNNLLTKTDYLFDDINVIKSFIDKNINDLQRIDIFFKYISKEKIGFKYKVYEYIQDKFKIMNESINKLKKLIRHELKNIIHI